MYKYLNFNERNCSKKIPLTLCPISNKKLQVFTNSKECPIRKFIQENILISVNSDESSYFYSDGADNFYELVDFLNLTKEEIILLAENSFKISFLEENKKKIFLEMIANYKLMI